MLVAADFREKARTALSGNWGVAIGTGFVASLLGAYTALDSGSGSSNTEISEREAETMATYISYEVLVLIALLVGIFAIVVLVFSLVRLIIGGPITLGYVKFNLDMLNGVKPNFSDLFSQFHRFGEAFCVHFLRGFFIVLWTLCLVIPGIIATYSYAMAPYILYENPGMPATEAISASKKMMDGNKWRLFCLSFSFIGWGFLAVLTLGIGFLWLNPYMEASYAAFYEELKREQFVMPFGSDYSQNENESIYSQYNNY